MCILLYYWANKMMMMTKSVKLTIRNWRTTSQLLDLRLVDRCSVDVRSVAERRRSLAGDRVVCCRWLLVDAVGHQTLVCRSLVGDVAERTCRHVARSLRASRRRQLRWVLTVHDDTGPDLSVWTPSAGSLLEARVVRCWCGCLSGARREQLYDLHLNSMTYTLFFYSRLSVSKSIFMFP